MTALQQFEKQQYLSLETFRKNGLGVKTPVWFASDGHLLYVWTEATSGKAKRIRNNSHVNVAASRGDGTPLGEWLPAIAIEDASPAAKMQVQNLMKKKYGFLFHVFALMGRLRGSSYTTLKINFPG